MHVPILAVAFSIYILGIAVVLYVRPHLMFRPGGSWKEFGVGRGENHTVIPFWLFAIFWAFLSYGVALVTMSHFATIAMSAFPESTPMPSMTHVSQPHMASQPPTHMASQPPTHMASQPHMFQQQQQMHTQPSFIKPVSSLIGIPNNQPGYYVLQNPVAPGVPPQYVYYGTSPPPAN